MPELHPVASEDAPFYIIPPGGTDWLYIVCMIILTLGVVGFGLVFFRLHSLPELLAHKGKRVQYELVAVLARPAQKLSATPIRSLRRCCNVQELRAFKSR